MKIAENNEDPQMKSSNAQDSSTLTVKTLRQIKKRKERAKFIL